MRSVRCLDAGGRVGLVLLERLMLEQSVGKRFELVAVGAHQLCDLLVLFLDQVPHLFVDELLGLRRDVAGAWDRQMPVCR